MSHFLQDIQEVRVSVLNLVMPINDYLIRGAEANEKENFGTNLIAANESLAHLDDLVQANTSYKKYALKKDLHSMQTLNLVEHVQQTISNIYKTSEEVFQITDPLENPLSGEKMEYADQEAEDISEELTQIIEQVEADQEILVVKAQSTKRSLHWALVIILLGILLNLFSLFYWMSRHLIKRIEHLLVIIETIKKGDLSARTTIGLNDEIGKLGAAFNEMAETLQRANQRLEEEVKEKTTELNKEKESLELKVRERTSELEELKNHLEENVALKTKELQQRLGELERLNKSMVGRELRMIELKKENEYLRSPER
jgi:nitrate/nitrite-specific signal transduction histidine kinase